MSPSEPSPTWSSAVSRNPSVETSSRVGQYQLGETIGTVRLLYWCSREGPSAGGGAELDAAARN
jgi:hypothetical protein